MNCAICLKELKAGQKMKIVETARRTAQGFDRDDLGELDYLHVRCWRTAVHGAWLVKKLAERGEI